MFDPEVLRKQAVLRIHHVADRENGKLHARLNSAVGWRGRDTVAKSVNEDYEEARRIDIPVNTDQFDKLLGGDVISDGYLDGCYELGKQYPDLCASVYVVCESGDVRS